MNKPSIERLRETLLLNPESGELFHKETRSWYAKKGVRAGHVGPKGYRVVNIDRKPAKAHHIVFALTHGRWPEGQIDHINGNRDDNRPCNLREATPSQNAMNRGLQPNNKSGHKGIFWNAAAQRWVVTVTTCGKPTANRFRTLDEAISARAKMVRERHREFANPEGRRA